MHPHELHTLLTEPITGQTCCLLNKHRERRGKRARELCQINAQGRDRGSSVLEKGPVCPSLFPRYSPFCFLILRAWEGKREKRLRGKFFEIASCEKTIIVREGGRKRKRIHIWNCVNKTVLY